MLLGTLVGSTCWKNTSKCSPPNMTGHSNETFQLAVSTLYFRSNVSTGIQSCYQNPNITTSLLCPLHSHHISPHIEIPSPHPEWQQLQHSNPPGCVSPLLPGLHWKDCATQHLLEFDWPHRHLVLHWAAPNMKGGTCESLVSTNSDQR